MTVDSQLENNVILSGSKSLISVLLVYLRLITYVLCYVSISLIVEKIAEP